MTNFCNCETCKKIKAKYSDPDRGRCPYCGNKHDHRVHCIQEVAAASKEFNFTGTRSFRTTSTKSNFSEEGLIPKNKEGILLKTIAQPGTTFIKVKPKENHPKALKGKMLDYCIEIDHGKYTVYQEQHKGVKVLRYGEPWRDCTGDNLIFHLMADLNDTKERIQKAIEYIGKFHDTPDMLTIIAILKDSI